MTSITFWAYIRAAPLKPGDTNDRIVMLDFQQNLRNAIYERKRPFCHHLSAVNEKEQQCERKLKSEWKTLVGWVHIQQSSLVMRIHNQQGHQPFTKPTKRKRVPVLQ